mgnify:CR=1 FL=1
MVPPGRRFHAPGVPYTSAWVVGVLLVMVTLQPTGLTELSLAEAGIGTVLWTTGYTPDYGWLDLPIFDEAGLPRHSRGISEVPGLSFIGLLWQHNNASANLLGVFSDAEYLVSRW